MGDKEKWELITLELLFDIEEAIGQGAPIRRDFIYYTRPFCRLAWRIMQAVSAQVPAFGCYLADEADDSEILRLLNGEQGNFWRPSLSIAPREFYEHYLPVPDHIAVKRQDEIGIFAKKVDWESFPWDDE